MRGVAFGALYGVMAATLSIVFRATRALSFAHGEIGALAVFVAWWLVERHELPWLVGALAGMAMAATVGLVFHAVVAGRLLGAPPLALSIATTGLLLALVAVEAKLWGEATRGLRPPLDAAGPKVLGHHLGPTALLGLGLAVAVVVIARLVLRRTDAGLALTALGYAPDEARLTGIRIGRLSAAVWFWSSVLAAVVALLLVPTLGGFAAGTLTLFFVRALAAAVIGGLGSIEGAVAGGLIVGLVEQVAGPLFVTSAFPGVEAVAVLAVVVVALLVRPASALGTSG